GRNLEGRTDRSGNVDAHHVGALAGEGDPVARPIPRAAPVTMAALPRRRPEPWVPCDSWLVAAMILSPFHPASKPTRRSVKLKGLPAGRVGACRPTDVRQCRQAGLDFSSA